MPRTPRRRNHRHAQPIDRAVVEFCESRRLMHQGPSDGSSWQRALGEAIARSGDDHAPEWYAPVGQASFGESDSGTRTPPFSVNAAGLPLLTSRADGQGLKVFLDFDGNGSNLSFSLDGDYNNFSTTEQRAIYDTWRDMVSFFSPLNLNFTTVQPSGGALFAWHLTSNSISGGYAYVGALSNNQPYGFNQGDNAVSRRSGIAHEIGHLLGLQHQSEFDQLGNKTSEYSDGFDNRHRTVIGIDYNTNIRQWYYGRSSLGASVLQDDLAYMAQTVTGPGGWRWLPTR